MNGSKIEIVNIYEGASLSFILISVSQSENLNKIFGGCARALDKKKSQ